MTAASTRPLHRSTHWGAPQVAWGTLADAPATQRARAMLNRENTGVSLDTGEHVHGFPLGATGADLPDPTPCTNRACSTYPRDRAVSTLRNSAGELLYACVTTVADPGTDLRYLIQQSQHLANTLDADDFRADPEARAQLAEHAAAVATELARTWRHLPLD